MAKQMSEDNNATANAGAGSAQQRAVSKASTNYCNTSWDLVDACREGTVKLAEIPAAQLPEAMKAMTLEQREAHVKKMMEMRAGLQQKIMLLNREREAFVAAELKKQAQATGEQTLDQALVETVRGQAASRGYRFGE
jgi:hypothetical protein